MSATEILWGQILVVFQIVLATPWGATQWTAWQLGFQPQLGQPWFELSGWPIYHPPAFFWWWYFYDAYAPHVFVEGAYIAASGGFIAIAVAIGMSVWRARETKNVETYCSARWARADEVRAAVLLGPDGVVLGKSDRAYLRHHGPELVLCFAPTRSGKGVGLAAARERSRREPHLTPEPSGWKSAVLRVSALDHLRIPAVGLDGRCLAIIINRPTTYLIASPATAKGQANGAKTRSGTA